MAGSLSLNGTWSLTYAEGSPLQAPYKYWGETIAGHHCLEARVPAPIHQVLQDSRLLEDINIGINSLKARWVEQAFWIYRRHFTAPAEALRRRAWLTFAHLELNAIVWLNGVEIGRHANAHRPACFEVTDRLRVGENLLVVCVESGLHANQHHGEKLSGPYALSNLNRIAWQRKPQYQSGWDWNPHLMNVGILGDVALEWAETARLSEVTVFAVPNEDFSAAAVTLRATVQAAGQKSAAAALAVRILEDGQEIVEQNLTLELLPEPQRVEVVMAIAAPKLWWPRGHGEQSLYEVEATLTADGDTQQVTRRTGVRRVTIDRRPHPETGEYFILCVNQRPIFCKGANWVPPEMLYSAVTEQRLEDLVQLAVAANFNLLRIWGGGNYADEKLCELCDRAGIMLWHDFAFACTKYPGYDPDFVAEVRAEAVHVVRRLAHHPALVLWAGNNEVEAGDWGLEQQYPVAPHHHLFHHVLPIIVNQEDPTKPYWPGSPYSSATKHPHDPTVGNQHTWTVSMQPGGADFWLYRSHVDRFPNEGGVLGASPPATLAAFLPAEQRYLFSPTWYHHDNPYACTNTEPGRLGHAYATVELWTGRRVADMDWRDYAFVSALLQAEGLTEYIANFRRRMFSSAAAVFWMFNDSWPVANGWTIVDYYLRKKLAYHPVRRAFAPVTVVAAEEGEDIVVVGVNDTPQPWTGSLSYGVFCLAGGMAAEEQSDAVIPANSAIILARLPRRIWRQADTRRTGVCAVLSSNGRLAAQHRLFVDRFKDLAMVPAHIEVTRGVEEAVFRSHAFAWGVCIDIDGQDDTPDNCFDLLPGTPYRISWPSQRPLPRILKVGNADALGAH